MPNPLTDPGRIAPRIKEALDNYGKHGLPTGDFLRAVLSNDLFTAFRRADPMSTATMAAIVAYITAFLPQGCYGSTAAVDLWLLEHRDAREAARKAVQS